jgi:hypothetical protein
LNLTGANFNFLDLLIIDHREVAGLILNDAVLDQGSFGQIIRETRFIRDASLVGLTFSDGNPSDLSNLLNISTLGTVTVDPALFNLYAAELNAFDALFGRTVIVVPEPSAFFLSVVAGGLALAFHRRRRVAVRGC